MPDPVVTPTLGTQLFGWLLSYLGGKVADATIRGIYTSLTKNKDEEKALVRALDKAITKFKKKHSRLYLSFFDEHFVQERAIEEFSKILVLKPPDTATLVEEYISQFGGHVEREHITRATEDFMGYVLEAMKEEPALRALYSQHRIDEIHQRIITLPTLDDFEGAIRKLSIPVQKTREEIIPVIETDAILSIFSRKSLSLLRWPQTLDDGEWIERPELDSLLAKIGGEEKVSVLLGAPGSGKSALLSRLGDQLIKDGVVCLALKAEDLPRQTETLPALQEWLGLPAPIQECFSRLAKVRPVVLLIDQLDALCKVIDIQTQRLSILLDLIHAVKDKENVHIIVSCREFEYRHDTRFHALDAIEENLELPSWETTSEILSARGIDSSNWPEQFREILRTPQHLKVFLELLVPNKQKVFDSYQGMLEEVWKQHVVDNSGSPLRAECINKIAMDMGEREELSVPYATYETYKKEIEQLIARGILRYSEDGHQIAFTHQTLFDFARTRAFISTEGSLSDYVLKRQDALFVRPVLWSALNYLRLADQKNYLDELGRIWEDESLRLHLRLMLIDFLGQLPDPSDQEADMFITSLEDERLCKRALISLQGSRGWFEKLESIHLPNLMKAHDIPGWILVGILIKAMLFARERVLVLVESHWKDSPEHWGWLFHFLREVKEWDPRFVELAMGVIKDSRATPGETVILAEKAQTAHISAGSRLVAIKLWQKLERVRVTKPELPDPPPPDADEVEKGVHDWSLDRALYNRFSQLIDDNDWHGIEKVATQAPLHFLDEIFPWFTEVLEEIAYDEHAIINEYRDDRSMGIDRSSYVVEALINAVEAHSQEHPKAYIEFVERSKSCTLKLIHKILAKGLVNLTTSHLQYVLQYLLEDSRRLSLGGVEDRHSISNALINNLVPNLCDEEALELEQCLLDYKYYKGNFDEDGPKERFERTKRGREHRLRLLRSFPRERLSIDTQKLLDEENRAFASMWGRDAYFSGGGTVGSPMSATQMEESKDENIIKLFDELTDETDWDHPKNRMSLIGGSVQASREFAEFSKQDPNRALALMNGFQPGKQERPAAVALREMANNGKIESKKLIQVIFDLVERGFFTDDFQGEIAWALKSVTKESEGLSDSICELLKGWLRDADVQQEESPEVGEDDVEDARGNSILWGMGGMEILPHGNFPILEALQFGYLLRKQPEYSKWLDVLEEHLERQETDKVWKVFLPHLRYLGNGDLERGRNFINSVFKKHPDVLCSKQAILLLARLHGWVDRDLYQDWMEQLLESEWGLAPQAFGELIGILAAIHDNWEWAQRQLELVIKGEFPDPKALEGMRLGLVFAAAHHWKEESYRPFATSVLIRLMPLGDGIVGHGISDVFRAAHPLPVCEETNQLLDGLIEWPQILESGDLFFLLENIPTLVRSEPDRAARLSMLIIDGLKDTKRGFFRHDTKHLVDVAITLQRMKEYRSHGMDIFERLMELEAYGTKEALRELDLERWVH